MSTIAELFAELLLDGLLYRQHRWVLWGLAGIAVVLVTVITWKLTT